MNSSKNSLQELVTAHLNECKKYIDAGFYAKALESTHWAKTADPRNIYIIALEKQIKDLVNVSNKKPLNSSHIQTIRSLIPQIIQHAIDDAKNRVRPKESDQIKQNTTQDKDDAEIHDREVALEKIKSKYFDLAEKFFNAGNYKSALEEVRRILIIDPDNTTAREYEQKITVHMSDRTHYGFKIRKYIPYAIGLLILANVVVFYRLFLVSDTEPRINNRPGAVPSLQDGDRSIQDSVYDSFPFHELNQQPDSAGSEGRGIIENETSEEGLQLLIEDDSILDEIIITNTQSRILVLKPASILHFEKPVYPEEAIERRIEGKVIVRILSGPAGIVNRSMIESSSHPILAESALMSARLSRFYPAEADEPESAQWVNIIYEFLIE